jgi:hypothetical protein
MLQLRLNDLAGNFRMRLGDLRSDCSIEVRFQGDCPCYFWDELREELNVLVGTCLTSGAAVADRYSPTMTSLSFL